MEGTLRPGWTYWAIAIVSLLWNAFGGLNYYMTQTRNAAYLASTPADVLSFIDALPVWVMVCWAIAIWASVLGSILLLARSRWAVTAFALSLLGLIGSTIGQLLAGLPPSMKSMSNFGLQLFIWAALIFFLWYARRAQAKGYLR